MTRSYKEIELKDITGSWSVSLDKVAEDIKREIKEEIVLENPSNVKDYYIYLPTTSGTSFVYLLHTFSASTLESIAISIVPPLLVGENSGISFVLRYIPDEYEFHTTIYSCGFDESMTEAYTLYNELNTVIPANTTIYAYINIYGEVDIKTWGIHLRMVME